MSFDLVHRITNEATTPSRHEESQTNDQIHGIGRLGFGGRSPWALAFDDADGDLAHMERLRAAVPILLDSRKDARRCPA
jgi:superfamily II DNA/RNA helicase